MHRTSSIWCRAVVLLALVQGIIPVKPSPIAPVDNRNDSPVTLRIIHITDVYTLENFPSLKNLIRDHQQDGVTTISMLTGDFLMPYLLSSVDGGKGMMNMMNEVPIDYLTWGNHEKDLDHEQLLERESEYRGTWINTNMQSHESYAGSTCQKDYDIIELQQGDHVRKLALLGILTNHPSLYPPGSFNGATIEDPWETMQLYVEKLENQVDMILPLCHLYEPQDERTAREFDFPLILGGHDHHPVDRTIDGTLLLKPGVDAQYARVIDITWKKPEQVAPTIQHELIRVQDYAPDPRLERLVQEAYSVLDPLVETQLAFIPDHYRPLTSQGARENRVSVATFLGDLICAALSECDAFIAKGGNIRGGREYEDDQEFTLELLQGELGNVSVYVTEIPGSVLLHGLRETWEWPSAGWFQHDSNVVVDQDGFVVSIGGERLDSNKMYRIATFEDFFRARDGPSIGTYYLGHPEKIPVEGYPVFDLVLKHVAKQWWQFLFNKLDTNSDGRLDHVELGEVDVNGSGTLDRDDIMNALERMASLQTFEGEYTLVDYILSIASGVENVSSVIFDDVNALEQPRKLSSSHHVELKETARKMHSFRDAL